MRLLVIGLLVMVATSVWAQPPPMDSPEVQRVAGQLNQVACQAVTMTSAQTIAGLQKQIADLKAQNDELMKKLDPPPKSGPTKK